jgi:hypothetical protein
MKIFQMQQGTPEWDRVRRGVVTASEIECLITPLWKPRTGGGAETYLNQKLAEKLIVPDEADDEIGGSPSYAADQGTILETLALPWFAFETGLDVQRVGFCLSDDGRIGCSPDGLIGEDAGIEVKSPQAKKHIAYLRAGGLPKEYAAQVHFSMLVTGRASWWFVSYSQSLPKLVVEVKRDESIQEKLRDVVDDFLAMFDREFSKLQEMAP